MASKVTKFGALEGGEDYAAYSENARKKKKTNGQMINLNDPQSNPDTFPQNGSPTAQPLRAADPKDQQSQAPQFAAGDNGDNVGYTVSFGNKRKSKKRKTKNGQPTVPTSEPMMNWDIHTPDQTQALPQLAQREPKQEAQRERPEVGAPLVDGYFEAYLLSYPKSGGVWLRETALNRGRFPLLNEGWVDKRAGSLVRTDDEQVYGGGGGLTVQQTESNSKDVVRFSNASQEFSAPAAESKAPFPMETKLSQVSNNDTRASDHLSTPPCNHKGQMGSCFPWLGRGMKTAKK